jgi:hypothetical protein
MADWKTTLTLARALPDVEESTSYGTPALKVKGKLMARAIESDAQGERIVARVESLEERAAMVAAMPAVFEITPHYQNYPWVVVHLRAIPRAVLKDVLADAWRVVTTSTKATRTRGAKAAPVKSKARRPKKRARR